MEAESTDCAEQLRQQLRDDNRKTEWQEDREKIEQRGDAAIQRGRVAERDKLLCHFVSELLITRCGVSANGAMTGHASSIVTLTNLARLGNIHVRKRSNCAHSSCSWQALTPTTFESTFQNSQIELL